MGFLVKHLVLFVLLVLIPLSNAQTTAPIYTVTPSNSYTSITYSAPNSNTAIAQFLCPTGETLLASYSITPAGQTGSYDSFKYVLLSTPSSSPFSSSTSLDSGTSTGGTEFFKSITVQTNTAYLYFDCTNTVEQCVPTYSFSVECPIPPSGNLFGTGYPSSASYLIVATFSDYLCTQLYPNTVPAVVASGVCTFSGSSFYEAIFSGPFYGSCDYECNGCYISIPDQDCTEVSGKYVQTFNLASFKINVNLYSDAACTEGQQQQTVASNQCSQMPSTYSGSANFFSINAVENGAKYWLGYNFESGCQTTTSTSFTSFPLNSCQTLANGQSVKVTSTVTSTSTPTTGPTVGAPSTGKSAANALTPGLFFVIAVCALLAVNV